MIKFNYWLTASHSLPTRTVCKHAGKLLTQIKVNLIVKYTFGICFFQCQVIMPLGVRGLAHFTPHLTQNMPLNGGHLSVGEWVFPQPYVIRRPHYQPSGSNLILERASLPPPRFWSTHLLGFGPPTSLVLVPHTWRCTLCDYRAFPFPPLHSFCGLRPCPENYMPLFFI